MKQQIKITKFYEYDQNNSGGALHIDKKRGIGQTVLIEAMNADHANRIARRKGLYFNGVAEGVDCDCCGDRWHPETEAGRKILIPPKINSYGGSYYIHFLDGKIFEIKGA